MGRIWEGKGPEKTLLEMLRSVREVRLESSEGRVPVRLLEERVRLMRCGKRPISGGRGR